MPELPEVETTRCGIEPHIKDQKITQFIIRDAQLRWPIPLSLKQSLPEQHIKAVMRRSKYLLLQATYGTLIIHLGMSGSLRILPDGAPVKPHDHADIVFAHGLCLRFNDPRKFGCLLWAEGDGSEHPLLQKLGPEPLSEQFTADYLYQQTQRRKTAIKMLLMDGHILAGVGNIYACEALFLAGINPNCSAKQISLARCAKLVTAIKEVLMHALQQGGTTIRNFSGSDGKPGYFKQQLKAYGRGNLPCTVCKTKIQETRQGQRSTFYCPKCQS